MRALPEARKIRQTRATARVAACCFGVALILWGIAPAIVGFLTSRGDAWQLGRIVLCVLPAALGATFIALAVLAGRVTRTWPLWTLLGLSAALFAVSVVLWSLDPAHSSLFPMLLTGCTAGATWLAIDAQRSPAPAHPHP